MRDIVSPLDGFRSPFGARRGFSPSSLFASGEQGVWYEPSPTTAFRSTTDLTPCGVGDSCGFLLDQSQGAGYSGGAFTGLGAELVPASAYDSDLSDWDLSGGATVSWASPGLDVVNGGGSFNEWVSFEITGLTVGRVYVLDVPLISAGAANELFTLSTLSTNKNTNNPFPGDETAVVGSNKRVFVAGFTSYWLNLVISGTGSAVYGQPSVRELPGNHATQATAAARPTLQQTAGGLYRLTFDGVDDGMVTPTITPGTDKVQVFAGVTKDSDAAQGVVTELSASTASNNGTLLLAAPDAASATFAFDSKGTAQTDAVATPFSAPVTAVLTGLGDISGDSVAIRVNGVLSDTDTGDQGTGNFLAYPLYIGARAGSSLFFNGHLYSLIARFGPNLDTATIEKTETYVAGKTGVSL